MKRTIIATALGLLLCACSGSSDGSEPEPTMTQTPSGLERLIVGSEASLTPGTYQGSFLNGTPGETPNVLVDVPSGWRNGDTWYVVSDDSQEFLGLYVVGTVHAQACADASAFDPGPSVQDLADALVDQTSTRASAPEPASLAGYDGLYVELAGPKRLSSCKEPGLWDGRGIYSDGQVDRLA